MPRRRLTQRKRPSVSVSPYASTLRARSVVSPAHTIDARPRRPTHTPLPQSSSHDAGLGGGVQSRSRMSQRTPALDITQPLLPDGDANCVNALASAAIESTTATAIATIDATFMRGL